MGLRNFSSYPRLTDDELLGAFSPSHHLYKHLGGKVFIILFIGVLLNREDAVLHTSNTENATDALHREFREKC